MPGKHKKNNFVAIYIFFPKGAVNLAKWLGL